jgi:hypothetical protein
MERQCPKVLAIEVEQVKRDEHARTTAEERITKHRPTGFINAGNLAVEDSTFNWKMFRDPHGEIRKATEHVSIA